MIRTGVGARTVRYPSNERDHMKVLGIIVLIVIAIAAVSGMGGSDDSASSAPAAAVADPTDDSAEAYELTTEAQEVTNRLVEFFTNGAENPAAACATLDTAKADITRIEQIVAELGYYKSVPPAQLAKLQSGSQEIGQNIPTIERGCAKLGL